MRCGQDLVIRNYGSATLATSLVKKLAHRGPRIACLIDSLMMQVHRNCGCSRLRRYSKKKGSKDLRQPQEGSQHDRLPVRLFDRLALRRGDGLAKALSFR